MMELLCIFKQTCLKCFIYEKTRETYLQPTPTSRPLDCLSVRCILFKRWWCKIKLELVEDNKLTSFFKVLTKQSSVFLYAVESPIILDLTCKSNLFNHSLLTEIWVQVQQRSMHYWRQVYTKIQIFNNGRHLITHDSMPLKCDLPWKWYPRTFVRLLSSLIGKYREPINHI